MVNEGTFSFISIYGTEQYKFFVVMKKYECNLLKYLEQQKNITVENAVFRFAGFMVLLSMALTQWLHPNFIWLTVFVGANLLQYSFSGFCLPKNERKSEVVKIMAQATSLFLS